MKIKQQLFIGLLASGLVLSAQASPYFFRGSLKAKQQMKVKVKLNLNKIDAKMLSNNIKGIGIKRAQAIVAYRQHHGQFKTIDDLAKVKGIGPKFVKKHRKNLIEQLMVQ